MIPYSVFASLATQVTSVDWTVVNEKWRKIHHLCRLYYKIQSRIMLVLLTVLDIVNKSCLTLLKSEDSAMLACTIDLNTTWPTIYKLQRWEWRTKSHLEVVLCPLTWRMRMIILNWCIEVQYLNTNSVKANETYFSHNQGRAWLVAVEHGRTFLLTQIGRGLTQPSMIGLFS